MLRAYVRAPTRTSISTALWTTSRGGGLAAHNGDFSTFTVVGGKATAPTRHADQYSLKERAYADGNTPAGG